eukprot:RCo043110
MEPRIQKAEVPKKAKKKKKRSDVIVRCLRRWVADYRARQLPGHDTGEEEQWGSAEYGQCPPDRPITPQTMQEARSSSMSSNGGCSREPRASGGERESNAFLSYCAATRIQRVFRGSEVRNKMKTRYMAKLLGQMEDVREMLRVAKSGSSSQSGAAKDELLSFLTVPQLEGQLEGLLRDARRYLALPSWRKLEGHSTSSVPRPTAPLVGASPASSSNASAV